MNLLGVFDTLLKQFRDIIQHFSQEISIMAIVLVILISVIRGVGEIFSKGYDHFMPFMKSQVNKVVIIIALSLPLGFAPFNNASFITKFPELVITIGFNAAYSMTDKIVSKGILIKTADRSGDSMVDLAYGLREKLGDRRGGKTDAESVEAMKVEQERIRQTGIVREISIWEPKGIIAMFIAFALLLVIGIFVAWPLIPLFVVVAPLAIVTVVLLFFILVEIILCLFFGAAIGETMRLIQMLIEYVLWAVVDWAVILTITFAFFAVLISTTIRGVIFSVLFPLSLINLSMESQKQVFFRNVMTAFHIALIPVVAVIILAISLNAYAVLTREDGIVFRMVDAFVKGSGNDGVLDAIAMLARWVFAIFITPVFLALPIARYVGQSSKIVGEFLGSTAGGWTSGISGAGAKVV
ncbi:MAG: hypothetical protein DDT19_00013 [Syntrophomonadaceae bacterium]|nr:hypothetical protein [Bacillota bacterium]